MQRDARSQKREMPPCVAVLCLRYKRGSHQFSWIRGPGERKRKEFLWRGATRRRMLARCFGGGLFFDILSLSSSCTCTYTRICMYVCACVYLGRLPLAPLPSLLSLSLFLSHTQLLSSFARSPLHLPPSRPFALDPSVKPTALSVSLSLSLLRIHSVSFLLPSHSRISFLPPGRTAAGSDQLLLRQE